MPTAAARPRSRSSLLVTPMLSASGPPEHTMARIGTLGGSLQCGCDARSREAAKAADATAARGKRDPLLGTPWRRRSEGRRDHSFAVTHSCVTEMCRRSRQLSGEADNYN